MLCDLLIFTWRYSDLPESNIVIVIPSLRANGGIQVLLNYATETSFQGEILVLWRGGELDEQYAGRVRFLTNTQLRSPFKVFAYAIALLSEFIRAKKNPLQRYILTHFTTFPVAIFANGVIIVAQGVEWLGFKNAILAKLAEIFCLFFYRNKANTTVAASATVQKLLASYGVTSTLAQVWANSEFGRDSDEKAAKLYDLVCVVRNVPNKRPDLYLRSIRELNLKTLIITPDEFISSSFGGNDVTILFRPSINDMRDAYRSARFQLYLSDLEGFGLPPLEGMGQGCVPLCRDSGGVRNYLFDELGYLILDKDFDIDEVRAKISHISQHYQHFSKLCRQRFISGATISFVDSLDAVVGQKWSC